MNNKKKINFVPSEEKKKKDKEKESFSYLKEVLKSFLSKKKRPKVKIKEERIVASPKGKGVGEYGLPQELKEKERVVVLNKGALSISEEEHKKRPHFHSAKEPIVEPLVEVSLTPPEEVSELKAERCGLTLFLVGLFSFIIIAGGFFILKINNWQLNKRIVALKKNLQQKDRELKMLKKEEKKLITFKKQLSIVDDLLTNHIYWTNFFTKLEKYTLSQVFYRGLDISTGNKISLRAAAPDYQTAAQQLLIFQSANDFIKEAHLSDLNYSKTNKGNILNFNLEIVLVKDLLKYNQ